MNSIIVYYSWMGNTEVVAKELNKIIGGDLVKVEEIKNRNAGIGFAGAAISALLGLKSKLNSMDFSLKGYDNIFLGGQVWAGHSTPAINSFINKADFSNKNVYLLLTGADDKVPQKVIDSIKKRVEDRGGRFVDSIFITTQMNSVISPEAAREMITTWIDKKLV